MDDDFPIDDDDDSPDDMDEQDDQGDQDDQEESFAELFESYSQGMNDDLRVGDKVHGRIISIGDSAVFIDTGSKADGVVELE
jgi:small subunit ribosomal protein S1